MEIPIDFDWQFYIAHYDDLYISGVKEERGAIRHYKIHGFREKRLYKRPEIKYDEYLNKPKLNNFSFRVKRMGRFLKWYKNPTSLDIIFNNLRNPIIIKPQIPLTNKKHTVVMLSRGDFAGSGEQIKQSVLSVSDEFQIVTVKLKKHIYGYNSDYILNPRNLTTIQSIIDKCDIVHFKGDELPTREWFGLKIPADKKIIITVGGSGFRRGRNNVSLQWHPIQQYLPKTNLRTTITPDLNYPEFESIYTPHTLDVKSIKYSWEYRPIPIIQHSPSSRAKKGTDDIIMPALKELKNEGHNFIIDLIENVSNEKCILKKQGGTIFIDQISKTGFYGMSSIESMQFGIPTIAYISETSKNQSNGIINENCPVQSVKTKDELKNVLRKLLTDKEYLTNLSLQTKKYVEDVHSYETMGEKWVSLYNSQIPIKNKRLLLSQYRPAIRLYKWANCLKDFGFDVTILSTGEPINNIDFSDFNMIRYQPNYNYKKDYDLHLSFNTNIKTLSLLDIKTIQVVGDLKGYYSKDVSIERESINRATKCVFVSEVQKEEGVKFYPIIKNKSSVVINGLINKQKPTELLSRINNGYFNVVYSGTISDDEKNHRYFIDFFKEITKSNLIKLHLYPSAVGLPKSYYEIENLIIHETVKPNDLIKELSQYDCGLIYLQNNKEIADSSLPNKLFEYLQAGLPIISGKYNQLINFNENKNAIVFFDDDNFIDAVKESQKISRITQQNWVITYESQIEEIVKIIEE